MDILTIENPVFCSYLFYSSILVLKMMFMSVRTGSLRKRKQVVANKEDLTLGEGCQIKFNDPDVERCRRAHLNDLENILPYFVASFCYVLTNPDPTLAINLFRIFTGARLMHTFVYALVVIPQPARGLSFFIGFAITGYMAFSTLVKYL